MGKFNRDRGGFGGRREGGFGGGRGGFNRGGRGGFGGRREGGFGGDRPDMHKAICAECGDECQVPFRPTGDRPVLCSSCFKGPGHNEPRREERRDFDRPRFDDKKMFDATCASCGGHCQVPFKPRPGKDVFCDACFGKDSKGDSKFDSKPVEKKCNHDKQFEALNAKLDAIMKLLGAEAVVAEAKVAPVEKKEEVIELPKVEEQKSEKKSTKKADKKSEKKEDKKKPAAKKVSKKK